MIQAKPRRPYLAMSESFQCHALGSLASEPRRLRLRVTSQPEAPSHVSEVGPGGGFKSSWPLPVTGIQSQVTVEAASLMIPWLT